MIKSHAIQKDRRQLGFPANKTDGQKLALKIVTLNYEDYANCSEFNFSPRLFTFILFFD